MRIKSLVVLLFRWGNSVKQIRRLLWYGWQPIPRGLMSLECSSLTGMWSWRWPSNDSVWRWGWHNPPECKGSMPEFKSRWQIRSRRGIFLSLVIAEYLPPSRNSLPCGGHSGLFRYARIPLCGLSPCGDDGRRLHIQRWEMIRAEQIVLVSLQFRSYGLGGLCDPINIREWNICAGEDKFQRIYNGEGDPRWVPAHLTLRSWLSIWRA